MQQQHQTETTPNASSRFIALTLTFLLAIGFFQCWIILSPHWLAGDIIPPGDDPAVHLRIITAILTGHGWLAGLPYPPLFHWLVASVSFVTHLSALQAQWVVTTLMIGLVPLCIGGIFVAREAKNNLPALVLGLVTLTGLLMLSRMPLRAWGDGNYPNILAQAILIPLMVFFMGLLHGKWNRVIAALVLCFLLLVFACHAMSILIALTIFLLGIIVIDLPNIRKYQLAGCAAIFVGIAWLKVVGPTLSVSAIHGLLQGQGNLVAGLSSSASQSTPLASFADFFGQPFLSTTLTLLLLAVALYVVERSARYTLLLMLLWAGSLFLASRVPGLAVPDRFLRDLSYPLIASGAVSVSILARRNTYLAVPIVLLVGFLGYHFATYLGNQPGAFASHPDGIRPIEQRVDQQTAVRFERIAPFLPAAATVFTNPTNEYVPYLVNHPTTMALTPLAPQPHDYYLILGPEPGGSLRSASERQFYQDVTTQLRQLRGRVVLTEPGITVLLVSGTQR